VHAEIMLQLAARREADGRRSAGWWREWEHRGRKLTRGDRTAVPSV